MTVREIVGVLKYARKIRLFYGDSSIDFRNDDEAMIGFFGKYAVDSVAAIDTNEGHYEIILAMRPVLEEKG